VGEKKNRSLLKIVVEHTHFILAMSLSISFN